MFKIHIYKFALIILSVCRLILFLFSILYICANYDEKLNYFVERVNSCLSPTVPSDLTISSSVSRSKLICTHFVRWPPIRSELTADVGLVLEIEDFKRLVCEVY